MTAIQRIGLPRPIAALADSSGAAGRDDSRPRPARRSASAASRAPSPTPAGPCCRAPPSRSRTRQTGKVFTVVTGGDGVYRVLDLEPGRYTRASSSCRASATTELPDVNLLLGKTLDVDSVADGRRRDRGHQGHGRIAAHRHAQHDHRAQRDRRGIRPHPEGPQLPEPRAVVAVGERGRGRRRHPGQRRQRLRELVHRRRRRHQQPRERRARGRTPCSSTCRKCRSRPAASARSTAARSAASSAR